MVKKDDEEEVNRPRIYIMLEFSGMPSNSAAYIKAHPEYRDNDRERERRKLANRNRRAK